MGRGRKPCCEKEGLKKGSWTQDEDKKLTAFIEKHGHGNWRALPKRAGLLRCGKSCRLRWVNYLRPDLKRGNLTNEEEETIIKLQGKLGNKWSKIAALLPGRTDNEIKNIWNTHLKRRLQLEDPNHSADDNTEQPPSSASSASTISCEDQRIGKTDQSENSTILDADEFMHIGALAEGFEIPVDQSLDKWCVLEDACSTNFPRETSYESMVALGDQLEDCLSSEYYPSSNGHQQAPSWGPQLWSPIDGDSNLFHYEFGGMVDQEEYNKDISSTDVVSTGEAETKRWFAYLEKELDLWD